MLKVYAHTDLLTSENRKHVFPLVLDLHFYNETFLSKYYKLVNSIEASDIVIFPLEYSYSLKNLKQDIVLVFDKAKISNKPIWIYSGGDYGYSLKDHNIFNFRFGGFKSRLIKETIMMPSFINDPYKVHLKKGFVPLNKEKFSKIGFVGHAKGGLIKGLKEFISYLKINLKRALKKEYADYQPFYPSSIKRAKYLHKLSQNKDIETNFVFRNKYRAGAKTQKEKDETSIEFYNNIFENPYTFCMRGGGNFSVRLYEALAVGRIPILINTDCLLPLNTLIDWSKHCVIIDETNIKRMNNEIIKFHKSISNEAFVKLQKDNRVLWNNFLTRHSFFKEIHDDFINKLKQHEL